jgi:hypothetical protein
MEVYAQLEENHQAAEPHPRKELPRRKIVFATTLFL